MAGNDRGVHGAAMIVEADAKLASFVIPDTAAAAGRQILESRPNYLI